jgi:sphingolipid delta-4 desaturase
MMKKGDFYWSEEKEPHFQRRQQILKDHPEVKTLFGRDRWLWLKTIMVLSIHLSIAFWALPDHFGWMIVLALFVGATFSHVLFLAIHEITHDLAFESRNLNNWLAIVTNIPIVFPFAMAFKYYHAEHHWQQGKDGVDTDIPTHKEALLFSGFLGKLFWMINQILFYAIRPIMVHHIPLSKWVVINLLFQLCASGLIVWFAGWYALVYLLISIFLSGGLHPIAGHFIAEHYVFKEGQETYSYYGPLNLITFNVGYHNEHHDFPNIPGSRLPQLHKMAQEYYDPLHSYNSWTRVLIRFLADKGVSLFSRVKRK